MLVFIGLDDIIKILGLYPGLGQYCIIMYMCLYCFLLQSIYFCKCMYCIKLMLIKLFMAQGSMQKVAAVHCLVDQQFFPHTNRYNLSLLCKSPSQNWLSSAIILISFGMTLSVNCKRPTPSSYVACSTSPLLPKHTLSTTFKVWHSYCCYLFDRLI